MNTRISGFLALSALALAGQLVFAQNTPVPTWIPDIKFASGREIVPYFEGWIKNPDDTFDFVFGYYNRNTQQELAIPAGPDNSVMPGGPDRGQPTYFMATRSPRVYRVRVPKDWGDKALTWTLTANGHAEKVVARLLPSYEKDEQFIITNNATAITFGEEDLNQPPTIEIPTTMTATVGTPLPLVAEVDDDGLPKPRPPAAAKPVAAPNNPDEARFQSQRNRSVSSRRGQGGIRVVWMEYRGPAKVIFETTTVQPNGGKAVTTAKFTAPGTYTLFATADDSKLYTRTETVVTVK